MRIVGLVGKAGSGKDTVARMILGAKQFSFADPLKEFVATVYGVPKEHLWGSSELRASTVPDAMRPDGQPLTVRHALQTLGTWGRDCDTETWVKLGMRRAQAWLAENPHGIAVFPDCRYINEARIITDAGGEVWRIVRPGAGLTGTAATHPSEMEQESTEMEALVKWTIHNTSTLENLQDVVNAMIESSEFNRRLAMSAL